MGKRIALLLCTLLLCVSCAQANGDALPWPPGGTVGQGMAQSYIERVNENLTLLGADNVNALFECFPGFASLGVVSSPDQDVVDRVELVLEMSATGLKKLTIRSCDLDGFASLVASCVQAASPDNTVLSDVLALPQAYVKRVKAQPDHSIDDPVEDQQGDSVRVYYTYLPKPEGTYGDGVNWITATIIFPWAGWDSVGVYVTPTPAPDIDYGTSYEGTPFDDGYTHLEVFLTPSPAPDDGLIR